MNAAAPRIFRITVEVANLEEATKFYAKLLGIPGQRHAGARHYFDCETVVLSDRGCARIGSELRMMLV